MITNGSTGPRKIRIRSLTTTYRHLCNGILNLAILESIVRDPEFNRTVFLLKQIPIIKALGGVSRLPQRVKLFKQRDKQEKACGA